MTTERAPTVSMPSLHFRHGRLRLLCALAAAASVAGCLSAGKKLGEEEKHQQAAWEKRQAATRPQSVRLTWDAALLRLRSGNEKLRAADLDCLRAAESLRQAQRSLIPLLSLQTGYNRPLSGTSGIDPFTFASSVFFDVPGMVGYRLRIEAARLVVLRAELGRELFWREQVVELYRRFRDCADREDELDAIAKAAADPALPPTLRAELEQRRLNAASDLDRAAAKLRDLVGDNDLAFRCAAESLPALGYDNARVRPDPSSMARLTLRLSAVELVGLEARRLGLILEGWPELSVYVSNPVVYRYSGDNNSFWSTHDVFAGANVNWSLDTRGRRAGQKRIQAAEAALRRRALEQEASRASSRIRSAFDTLAATDADLASLPDNAPSSAVTSALAARRLALLDQRRECQLALWFFDDERWPGVPPLHEPAAP